MAKIFGVNTKISGKVGQLLYRQTRTGTVVSELPVKPVIPRRSARQMDRRAQWANLGAIYKQFDAMLRKGYENLPPQMSVYNAFIQANIDVVKVYITKTIRLNGGAILAPYQITRGSLPSIGMAKNASNILVSSVALGTLAIDANTTVGQFSQAVIDNNDSFLEGDQLTRQRNPYPSRHHQGLQGRPRHRRRCQALGRGGQNRILRGRQLSRHLRSHHQRGGGMGAQPRGRRRHAPRQHTALLC